MKNNIDWIWRFIDKNQNEEIIRVFYKHSMRNYYVDRVPETVSNYMKSAEKSEAKTIHGTTTFYKMI